MVQAVLGVRLSYIHVPGKDNEIADALSRAHLNYKYSSLATDLINNNNLKVVQPCMFAFDNIPAPIYSRSAHRISVGQSDTQTTAGQSSGHKGKPTIIGRDICGVRKEGAVPTHGPHARHDMRIH